MDRDGPPGPRHRRSRMVLRALRAHRPRNTESDDAPDGPRHRGPVRVDSEPDRLVPRCGTVRTLTFLGSVSAAVIVLLLAIPVHVAMVHEEGTLEARFGDTYRAYRAAVPRWIPRPRSRQS